MLREIENRYLFLHEYGYEIWKDPNANLFMRSLFTVLGTSFSENGAYNATVRCQVEVRKKIGRCRRWIFNRSEHRYNLGWIRSEPLSPTFSSSFYLFLRSPRITCGTSERGKGGKASQKVSATGGRNVNGHEHSVSRLSIVLTVPVYPSARYTCSFASPKRFRRLANRVYGWLIGSVRRRWPWSLAVHFISPFLFHQRAISSPGCRVDSHLTRTESTITSPRESFSRGDDDGREMDNG